MLHRRVSLRESEANESGYPQKFVDQHQIIWQRTSMRSSVKHAGRITAMQRRLGCRHSRSLFKLARLSCNGFFNIEETHAPGGRRPWLFFAAWSISSGVISAVALTLA
jgi:hypothetical protein